MSRICKLLFTNVSNQSSFGQALGSYLCVLQASNQGSKQVYFGDLHIHTQLSMDAFLFGNRTTPDQAYRFAKGEPVTHASGEVMQLEEPLDFYAVTDHAEYLGLLAAINSPGHPLHSVADAQPLLAAWQQVIDAAEAHNEPGRLTTFTGFAYTSFRATGNLHRNVIFQGSRVSEKPFGRLDSLNPEDLWQWMDNLRAQGIESLSIPHNSNRSDGWMFETRQFDGAAVTPSYSAMRLRNEPLIEVTQVKGAQVKGTSETSPFLSSSARDALKNGLLLESKGQGNPYQVGMIGSSDGHTTGLTGVWAEENSRAAIYAALRRKETFATTGTRIKVRMFAGFRLPLGLHSNSKKSSLLKKRGVPMGGELTKGRGPLMISAEAMQDPRATPLQRLQVIKGWVEEGKSFEAVFDVACADGAAVDPATHRCPDNNAGVDLVSCQVTGEGAASLSTVWSDPDFDAAQAAFYYVRAIENPSCRWSTRDALRSGVAPRAGLAKTLQERAYTSPVWYAPK